MNAVLITKGNLNDELMTPVELAKVFKKSLAWVYSMVAKRIIPFHKIQGTLRFSKTEIEKYLISTRVKSATEQYEYFQAEEEILD
jgi:excisionase family DNA binding protein